MKMTTNNTYKKKLIEVALPLEAINTASAREKSIRHGHPSTLHLWWARRPLAAARAVIFSQMVDDPSSHPELFPTEDDQGKERQRLFRIIEDLVLWENTTNEEVLNKAREEIWKSWRYTCEENKDHPQAAELFNPDKLPAFHDPFAGGGALPLEAQRLGLEAYASDLNPVAVLINKAMIEIPPKFANRPPVNPESRKQKHFDPNDWKGAQGLAEDVRYYGQWMRDEAEKRIGHLYPKVEITEEMVKERPDLEQYVGQKLMVIAWLWARTVKCPNPACGCEMPLISSFVLSSKKGKECYLIPSINEKQINFSVQLRQPYKLEDLKKGYKRGVSGIFECAFCGTVTKRDYVAEQAIKCGLGSIRVAAVAEGNRSRVYLPNESISELVDLSSLDLNGLDINLSPNPRDVWCRNFGLLQPVDLFTPRQLMTLTTLSSLLEEIHNQVTHDSMISGLLKEECGLDAGGNGTKSYADAIVVYLALLINQLANHSSSLCGWNSANAQMRSVFARQALPMVWDYAESNPFCNSSGSFNNLFERMVKSFSTLGDGIPGFASQADANNQTISSLKVVSTDPPYYDNIGYADLSDFFGSPQD
jgi:putative DNA methylase